MSEGQAGDVRSVKQNNRVRYREKLYRKKTFSYSFRPHYGPGVDADSNRNECQGYFLGKRGKGGRCVRLTILPPSCADCLEIWELQPPGTLRACAGL